VISMNDKYTDLMKKGAMNRQQAKEAFVQDLYIEMLLAEIQLTTEKERLMKKIDQAIDTNDKNQFMKLSRQLVDINKRFGT